MKRIAFALALGAATAALAQSGVLSGVDQAGIDKASKPGDNFDQYANGAWRAAAQIPPDRNSVGVGYDLTVLAEGRNAALVQSQANAAPGTDGRRVADYYAAYLNTDAIEARGLAPLRPQLDTIAAIADKRALARAIGATIRSDTDPINNTKFDTENLFGLFVTQDLNRPTVTVPYLMQGGLGMPDRDYYLSTKPDMIELRAAYGKYVAQIMKLAGYPNPELRAAAIVALETKIATAQFGIEQSQDAHNVQSWRRADFVRRAPGLDWNGFWAAAGLPRQAQFSVWQPAAISGEARLIGSEPLSVWKDWLAFHQINQLTSVLPRAFDDARFAFYSNKLNGTPAQLPRDKRALAAVNQALGDAVGKLYAQRYVPAGEREELQHDRRDEDA